MIKIVRPSLPSIDVDGLRKPVQEARPTFGKKLTLGRQMSDDTILSIKRSSPTRQQSSGRESSSSEEVKSPVSTKSVTLVEPKENPVRRNSLKRRSSTRSLRSTSSREDLTNSKQMQNIRLLTAAVGSQNETIKKIELELRTQRQLFIQGISKIFFNLMAQWVDMLTAQKLKKSRTERMLVPDRPT